ncbi:MAG: tetratricopeptide repeat protein [Candidatus Sericytochromatia bacterium]|nr:tetratricopeptide repeat protein [Candidatus Sericytochromatia bacterium]
MQPELATAYQLRTGLYDKVYQQADKARPDFARSVALAPERPEVLLTAARFYLAQSELTEAEGLLLKARQLQPVGEPGADVLFLLAQLEQTRQRFEQALAYYAQAVAHPAVQQSLAQATYRRAQASLLAQQRLSEALQVLTPVLQQYPDREDAQNEYKLYFVQQQLQQQPADARLHNELGQLYIKLNQPEKALKALLQAYQLDARQAVIAYNLGLAHQTLNQVSEARAAFKAALQLDPAYTKARLGLAQLSYQAGELARAEAELTSLLKAQPDYVPAMSLLGQLRQQQGQIEAARLLWQRVLALDPQNHRVSQWLQRLAAD